MELALRGTERSPGRPLAVAVGDLDHRIRCEAPFAARSIFPLRDSIKWGCIVDRHAKLPPVRRLHPANFRAAWWAIRTARRTRRLLAARGLHAALVPPPPPPLPVEAERGVRGGLRRWHESCLVDAIVLQAWEAAHGRRRDLVVGITGPDGFRAHAWLEGDPVPSADAAELDASVLNASPGEGWAEAPAEPNAGVEAGSGGNGTPTPYSELLRRPAPHYRRARSARAP